MNPPFISGRLVFVVEATRFFIGGPFDVRVLPLLLLVMFIFGAIANWLRLSEEVGVRCLEH